MIYKDISEQIEELRCKLHKELEKSGFDTKKALKISEELDELIENFYVEKNMKKTNDNNSFIFFFKFPQLIPDTYFIDLLFRYFSYFAILFHSFSVGKIPLFFNNSFANFS